MDRAPACPRCGYDLSGQIAAWPQGECPLTGTCSECGLVSRWRDVLNPEYNTALGHFEHARHRKVRAFLRTLAAIPRPWRLWTWLSMSHRISWSRIALLVAAATILATVIPAVALNLHDRYSLVWVTPRSLPLWTVAWPYYDWFWPFAGPRPRAVAEPPPFSVAMVASMMLLAPTCFVVLPVTLRRARVRPSHIHRIFAYQLPALGLVVMLPAVPLAAWLRTAVEVFAGFTPAAGWSDHAISALILLAITSGWMLISWWCAARLYLRLPHALGVALAITLLAFLVNLLIWTIAGMLWPPVRRELMNLLA